ncbi:MAG TPA: hypothetical protein VGS79_09640 [Puia sp.]|nr:hypothetical protein [Puia sp.]
MQKHYLQYDTRKARIYKEIYRPSSLSLPRFLGTLLSILFQGQSQVGGNNLRLHKRRTF